MSNRCLLPGLLCLALTCGCDRHEEAMERERVAAEKAAQKALIGGLAPIEVGDPAWDRDTAVRRSHQEDITRWIVEHRPELAPIAQAMRDQQLWSIELQSARYAHLVRHDPDRIVRDRGISVWRNFEWNESDDSALQLDQPRVREIIARKEALERSIGEMEGGDELRAFVRASFSDPEFIPLLTRLKEASSAVEKMLESSR